MTHPGLRNGLLPLKQRSKPWLTVSRWPAECTRLQELLFQTQELHDMPKLKAHSTVASLTSKITALTALVVALGALIDAGISIVGKVETPMCRSRISFPWCATSSDDTPARSQETDATRVHSFEFETSAAEFKPGLRKWSRIAPDVWEQLYPDGSKTFNYKVKRISLYDCDGTVVSPKEDPDFQSFFPDKGCETKQFMFRRLSQGTAWHSYVPIEHVE